jgi:predicted ATPase
MAKKENQESLPPVYFSSIEVENVLCFKSPQKLDFCDVNGKLAQWTVILGDNGVGKTTILRCLVGMEPQSVKMTNEYHLLPRLFNDSSLSMLLSHDTRIAANFFENHFSYIKKSNFLSRKSSLVISQNRSPHLETSVKNKLNLYGYGANRQAGKTSLSITSFSDNTLTLFSDSETLINAEEWLLQADYAVARSDSSTNKFQKTFDLVRDTLLQLLPEVTDIRITPADDDRPRPIAEFLTPYGWVSLSQLGLGYRTVIAWMVDLSARMIQDNPHSENPLAEPAVVLVDEIDLHLHPKWQRTIMSFLTERFPNAQFIVTAHSPLVVQAARNANIVLLRREGDQVIIDNNPEIIENWRVEQVLTSVFELPSTHPADIEPLIQERRKILAKSTLTKKDKQKLQELEAKIGSLPTSESPADIQAMDIIRKAAKLLENKQSAK